MESLEKLLAYLAIKPFLKNDEWIELGKKLKIDGESLKRTWGKEVEDIFFLTAFTYGAVEHIVVFNEGFAKLSLAPTPDGLLMLKTGRNLLIEVKGTQKDEWTISKGRVKRQKEFALKVGMDLYFAVYIKGYWGLFSADFIEQNSHKIKYPRDLKFSEFESIFDSRVIEIPKGLKVIKRYETNPTGNTISPYPVETYGYLVKYELRYNNISVDLTGEETLLAISAIEAKFNTEHKIEKIADGVHIVTHECTEKLVAFDYDLVLSPINQTISSKTNDLIDSSSFVSHVLDDLQSKGTVALVNFKNLAFQFFANLKKDGIPFSILKISEIDDIDYQGL